MAQFKYGSSTPSEVLTDLAAKNNVSVLDREFQVFLDANDELSNLRDDFLIPKKSTFPGVDCDDEDQNENCAYLCGNSLGLQPKSAQQDAQKVLQNWELNAIECHKVGYLPAIFCDNFARDGMAKLVGCHRDEVVIMNGLTVNLHLMMVSFYQPTQTRHKILIEEHAFPSDYYVVRSQIQQRGFDPDSSMLFLKPRKGEEIFRMEDVLEVIKKEGDSIALVMLPGVHYFTGQVFDIKTITHTAHAKGCYVGFDLAHAVGNIELELHEWDVDFSCWCTYKYLNSGPGNLGAAFVHKKFNDAKLPKFLGWWGHRESTRFEMSNDLDFASGAESYRLSNPPPLLVACVLASLKVFGKTNIRKLREKSFLLTGYLEFMLKHYFSKQPGSSKPSVEILTPTNFNERGCQVSLRFSCSLLEVSNKLKKEGMIFDTRQPNVMRVSPVPLYNTFHDVYRFVQALRKSLSI